MSLGLLGAYHSSSSGSDTDDDGTSQATAEQPQATAPAAPKLANPFLKQSAADTYKPSYMVQTEEYHKTELVSRGSSDSSVFSNPFKAKEDRKRAMLERHVEMTAKQEDQRTLRGKKICWNFRKGRCRFGSKCTFAHDNDVALPKDDEAEGQDGQSTAATPGVIQLGTQPPHTESDPDPACDNSSPAVISHNKRKRPGLSDGLTPSKKASKFYNKVYNNTTSTSSIKQQSQEMFYSNK